MSVVLPGGAGGSNSGSERIRERTSKALPRLPPSATGCAQIDTSACSHLRLLTPPPAHTSTCSHLHLLTPPPAHTSTCSHLLLTPSAHTFYPHHHLLTPYPPTLIPHTRALSHSLLASVRGVDVSASHRRARVPGGGQRGEGGSGGQRGSGGSPRAAWRQLQRTSGRANAPSGYPFALPP